ncbi:hypothetical protein BDV98DRAFT_289428 [Pterulicium gracile]|uniref:Uncharacterized protein n=1 Tax=Pterulicium gracile TaxID=1884261 RepID=A0A5C3QTB5_9AGAR|nr:hypothetical protein BDV98DRAFT_289428 [Pterula gracilis]
MRRRLILCFIPSNIIPSHSLHPIVPLARSTEIPANLIRESTLAVGPEDGLRVDLETGKPLRLKAYVGRPFGQHLCCNTSTRTQGAITTLYVVRAENVPRTYGAHQQWSTGCHFSLHDARWA